jgi:hypothetical protein
VRNTKKIIIRKILKNTCIPERVVIQDFFNNNCFLLQTGTCNRCATEARAAVTNIKPPTFSELFKTN